MHEGNQDVILSDVVADFATSDHLMDLVPASSRGFEKVVRFAIEVINLLNISFDIPHFNRKSYFPFITSMDLDLDTMIPSYIADYDVLLSLLLSVDEPSPTKVFGPALPPLRVNLVPYEDSDEKDEVREIKGHPNMLARGMLRR